MTFNPNDPKWTAYVAGELDAAERAAVEQELAESTEARSLVADIEKVIGVLVTQLKTEPVPTAPATMIADRTTSVATKHLPKARLLYISAVGSAAAALLGVGLYLNSPDRNVRETADSSQKMSEEASVSPSPPMKQTAARYDQDGLDRNVSGPAETAAESRFGDIAPTGNVMSQDKQDAYYRNTGGQGPGKVAKNLPANKGEASGRDAGQSQLESDLKSLDAPYSNEGKSKVPSIVYTTPKPTYDPKPADSAPLPTSPIPGPALQPSSNPVPPPVVSGLVKEARPTTAPAADGPAPALPTSLAPGDVAREKAEANYAGQTAHPAAPAAVPAAADPFGDPRKIGISNSLSPAKNVSSEIAPAGPVSAPDSQRAGKQLAGGKDNKVLQGYSLPEIHPLPPGPRSDVNGEAYEQVTDNVFMAARENPLSTFSIDVDTASYSNIRRFLTQNRMLPPPAAVRIEEMVNYFRYDYPQPEGETPFQANIEIASCPWQQEHRLVRVGIKGREIASNKRPPSNLVFLVDVSGSMAPANKLPLVKEGLKMLTRQLTENDRIAIVVYAGSSGLVLPSTTGDKQQTILDALDRLEAGGSTNGAQGIQLAYEIALQNFLRGCTNRVILATDGDFNVGITDRSQLTSLIEQQAKSGVFLTTLGFGMGNIKDATLEQLADKGNGAYAYVDDLREAKKVLVDEMSGTLVTIAKDVKIQIEFNPAEVGSYRLIGYENRILKHEDFNNDQKDAGEIGAGHTVTALYEVVPVGKTVLGRQAVDPLKYQPKPEVPKAEPVAGEHPGELLTLKLRYKQPDGDTSKLLEYPVKDSGQRWGQASGDFKFAASVALFGMILRNSPHKGTATLDAVAELANEGRGSDESGYRQEFISLVQTAKSLGK